MEKLSLYIYLIILTFNLSAQTTNYKELGKNAFELENYPLAINYMQKALENDTTDKDIYYYLGYYIHYNAYDSRPLKGYDLNYSDTVLYYFDKALELDPNYGDAKYFYTAECGANAFYSLQQRDYQNVKKHYQKAYDIGGFPEWSIEYGKLLLGQVEKNGILFTHGDFQLNICWYLQFCEEFRKDISVIPLTMLNRPFFVKEIKNSELISPVKIGISDEQILNMHPFKWKETVISLPIPEKLVDELQLDTNTLEWNVKPDLIGARDLLSCERAFLLEIIESNNWERPIYWTLGIDAHYLGGLDTFGCYKGMVFELMPFETKDTNYESDFEALQELLNKKNLTHYNSILTTNQPRVSGILMYTYSNAITNLTNIYLQNNDNDKVSEMINFYNKNIKIGLNNEYEEVILKMLKMMDQ